MKWKLGEKIGGGGEKEVFEHGSDSGKVIARLRGFERTNESDSRQLKGRFYLTKILHFIFPEVIPDIYVATAGGGRLMLMILEKKLMDAEFDKIISASRLEQPALYRSYERRFKPDPRYQSFLEDMRFLGIEIDRAGINIGYDENNNLVYLDNDFKPWGVMTSKNAAGKTERSVLFFFNKERLEGRISLLLPETRLKAKNYLARLEKLAEEDFAGVRKYEES